jgi:hypothetical protein
LEYSESQTTRTQQQQQQQHNQMSATNTQTNFDGIHVSKGFVRGLQGQVLKLEQNQQSLIRQLEHANKLASEYHATAVAWQHKYDIALHEMEKTKQAFDHERTQWNSSLNQVVELYEREKKLRLAREHEMTHLEQLLAEQIEMSTSPSPSPSPSPDHPHRNREDSLPPHEPMSPVSIPSSSPREVTIARPAPAQAQDEPQDEYERDPEAYWRSEYPKWQCKYHEENQNKNQEGGDSDIESDDIDWEQRERDDWTESIRSRARARVSA